MLQIIYIITPHYLSLFHPDNISVILKEAGGHSLCLSFETHVDLALYPFATVWHINLLRIIICEAAHIRALVNVVEEIGQFMRELLGISSIFGG